jgi:hypothetical protein
MLEIASFVYRCQENACVVILKRQEVQDMVEYTHVLSFFIDADSSTSPRFHDRPTHRGRLRESNFASSGIEFASIQERLDSLFQEVVCDALTAVRARDEKTRYTQRGGQRRRVEV